MPSTSLAGIQKVRKRAKQVGAVFLAPKKAEEQKKRIKRKNNKKIRKKTKKEKKDSSTDDDDDISDELVTYSDDSQKKMMIGSNAYTARRLFHESCSKYLNLCDLCGKVLSKK